MASRLNYGKRFRSGAVSTGYHYSQSLHRGLVPKAFLNMAPEDRSWSGVKGAATWAAMKSTCYLGKPVEPDLRAEAEERLIERINQCIDIMIFSVEDLMMAPPSPLVSRMPTVNQQQVIDLIDTMSRIVARDYHHWGVYRRPGIVHVRRCVECGTELVASEKDRCAGCADNYDTYKHAVLEEAKIERLAKREKERTIKTMQIILGRMQKRLERHHAKHRRHQGEDAGAMDATGRGQDLGVGSATAHRTGAGDPGHPQGGNDGIPSEPDPHPGSAGSSSPAAEGDGEQQGG
jgi:hypothetical protein